MKYQSDKTEPNRSLQTKLTPEELSELCHLARQDGWTLEEYATEILRGHLYVTKHFIDNVAFH